MMTLLKRDCDYVPETFAISDIVKFVRMMTLLKREETDSPRPLMGEGEGERVKECNRRLECNHPLSLTLSHAGADHYPQVSPCYVTHLIFCDFYLLINNRV